MVVCPEGSRVESRTGTKRSFVSDWWGRELTKVRSPGRGETRVDHYVGDGGRFDRRNNGGH